MASLGTLENRSHVHRNKGINAGSGRQLVFTVNLSVRFGARGILGNTLQFGLKTTSQTATVAPLAALGHLVFSGCPSVSGELLGLLWLFLSEFGLEVGDFLLQALDFLVE